MPRLLHITIVQDCENIRADDDESVATHDWEFLLPLAFPPDLPPVILTDLSKIEIKVMKVLFGEGVDINFSDKRQDGNCTRRRS